MWGKVTLTAVDVYGQEFTISRIFREAPNVYLGGSCSLVCRSEKPFCGARSIFGQKDLSSTEKASKRIWLKSSL